MAVTTQKQPKSAEPAAPATFEEIANRKMGDALAEYRTFVQRAAASEPLTDKELERVVELLAQMALPDMAWARDIETHRDHVANANRESELAAMMPEAEARAAKSTRRLQELEQELKQLREQHYRDTTALPNKLISCGQRRNELAALNPHLFADISEAVRLRRAARNKTRPMPAEPVGWSS